MKTLANCTPREFLKQTNRIRIAADKWLTGTKILEIRKRMPQIEATKATTREEVQQSIEQRNIAFAEQTRKNTFAILEAMLEDNFDETLELLALVCFIEPSEIDNYTMSQLLEGLSEVITDSGVLSFFGSLVKLGESSLVSIATR